MVGVCLRFTANYLWQRFNILLRSTLMLLKFQFGLLFLVRNRFGESQSKCVILRKQSKLNGADILISISFKERKKKKQTTQ